MLNQALYLTRDESQKLDQKVTQSIGIPSLVLMENAGRSAVDFFLPYYESGKVVICCGKGNNGGDGLVVARHLANHNVPVNVLIFALPHELTRDAQINYRIVVNSGIKVDCFAVEDGNFVQTLASVSADAVWIVDAIFGIGLVGHVKSPYDGLLQSINDSGTKILSLDIPSGLDCDTGKPLGVAVRANHTVTFVAMKKGFLQTDAQPYLGNVYVADIGIPRQLLNLRG